MNRWLVLTGWLVVIVVIGFLLKNNFASPPDQDAKKQELIKRGEYLVSIGGCNDCHTPKKFTEKGMMLDETHLLSGHPANSTLPRVIPSALKPGDWLLFSSDLTAAVGPWGMSFSANLTPDEQTGIGLWTPDIFIKALRSGLHMGAGRPILPPMPWQMIRNMTDEDMTAVFAYLKSLPPVKNQVPAPVPPDELADGF
jgi:mono/diheme cytochrome c family protein